MGSGKGIARDTGALFGGVLKICVCFRAYVSYVCVVESGKRVIRSIGTLFKACVFACIRNACKYLPVWTKHATYYAGIDTVHTYIHTEKCGQVQIHDTCKYVSVCWKRCYPILHDNMLSCKISSRHMHCRSNSTPCSL